MGKYARIGATVFATALVLVAMDVEVFAQITRIETSALRFQQMVTGPLAVSATVIATAVGGMMLYFGGASLGRVAMPLFFGGAMSLGAQTFLGLWR